jgi:Do/DeqQ family serine protease
MMSKRNIYKKGFMSLLMLAFVLSTFTMPTMAGDTKTQSKYPVESVTFDSPFVAVADRLKPSVVYISVIREENVQLMSPFWEFHPFLGPFKDQEPEQKKRKVPSSGSGLIIDEVGYVLTNNHVVESAIEITVKLADGSEREGEIVGTDPDTDLALLKIGSVDKEFVAPLGDSDNIRIGDWAIAMGSPLGLEWTLTVGVISAKGRSNLNIAGGGPVFQDFIQTDASINFGNSGGPLTNIHGEVIGINAAINARAENIGFAIPINIAKDVVEQLINRGSVERGYLGMVPTPLTQLMKEALNLDEDIKGVFVEVVESNTPAAEGGLEESDVIVEVDGKDVEEVTDFRFRVARHAPGDSMELTVLRNGKKKKLDFVLGSRSEYLGSSGSAPAVVEESWMGLNVESLNRSKAQRYNLEVNEGMLITGLEEDSPAAGKLRRGDVIIEIDQQEVLNSSDYNKVTASLAEEDRAILVKYHPQGREATRFIALKR